MKQPWEWDEDDIIRLVDERVSESINVEFKGCGALRGDGWRTELAKDVSAFANSAGAAIIFGIAEDRNTHEAKSIDGGYDPREINIESLEQVINSRIHRKIEGIRYNVISLNKTNPGRVLFLLYIPESSRALTWPVIAFTSDTIMSRSIWRNTRSESVIVAKRILVTT